MTTFVKINTQNDDVLYTSWGEYKKDADKTKQLLKKQGEPLEGVITEISDSPTYTKVYKLKVKGIEKPVIVTGKTDLNNKFGYGDKPAKTEDGKPFTVKVGDLVQIIWKGAKKTGRGRPFNQFEVNIAQ